MSNDLLIIPLTSVLGSGTVYQKDADSDDELSPAIAYVQLSNPDPTRTTNILNVSPLLAREHNMKIPDEIAQDIEPESTHHDVLCNVTPTHTIVEPHIGHGLDGVLGYCNWSEDYIILAPDHP
jgi:hypothetical protein